MAYIVIIVDEFNDLIMQCGQEANDAIVRLAQKARACGIYLIICTQRPSVNVITGDIKAVIPSRVGLLTILLLKLITDDPPPSKLQASLQPNSFKTLASSNNDNPFSFSILP